MNKINQVIKMMEDALLEPELSILSVDLDTEIQFAQTEIDLFNLMQEEVSCW